jgi:hypothetical protein
VYIIVRRGLSFEEIEETGKFQSRYRARVVTRNFTRRPRGYYRILRCIIALYFPPSGIYAR